MMNKKIKKIFRDYFGYHNLSFLVEDLFKTNQAKNEQIVHQANDTLIHLRNAFNKKEFLKMEMKFLKM